MKIPRIGQHLVLSRLTPFALNKRLLPAVDAGLHDGTLLLERLHFRLHLRKPCLQLFHLGELLVIPLTEMCFFVSPLSHFSR